MTPEDQTNASTVLDVTILDISIYLCSSAVSSSPFVEQIGPRMGKIGTDWMRKGPSVRQQVQGYDA